MTTRFSHTATVADLKRQKVRRPIVWRIPGVDVERFAAAGQHCQTRWCREPITVVTWRWWRSTEVGKVLVAEHFRCDQHGQEFAARHHIEVEPTPDEPSAVPAPTGWSVAEQ